MLKTLDQLSDLAIAHYLDRAEFFLQNRKDAWIALAWNLFNETGGIKHRDYDLIRSRIPENVRHSSLSIQNILNEYDAEAILSNPIGAIDAVCRYYSSSSFTRRSLKPNNDILARFMVKMADPKPNEKFYLPFAGLAKEFDYLHDSTIFVQAEEIDPIIWSFAIIRNFILKSKINLDNFSNEDSIEVMRSQVETIKNNKSITNFCLFSDETIEVDYISEALYDKIILSPPRNLERGERSFTKVLGELLDMAMSLLKEDGKLILTIPSIVFTKPYYLHKLSSLYKHIKQIVEIRPVQGPRNLSYINEPMVILEITKAFVETIDLVDANNICPNINNLSGDILDKAIDSCLNSNHNFCEYIFRLEYKKIKDIILLPSYHTEYNRISKGPHISLRECMKPILTKHNPTTEEFPCVSKKFLSNNYLDCDIDLAKLPMTTASNIRHNPILTENATLISLPTYGGFTFGKIELKKDEKVILDPNIFPFTIDTDKINPDYLLKKISGDQLLKLYNQVRRDRIYREPPQEFLDLIIPLPDLDKQNEIVLEDARKSISQKQAEILDLNAKYLTEIRLRKHTLITKMATFINDWESLYDLLQENNCKIDLKADGEWISKMGNYLKTINEQLCTLTETQEDFGDNSPIHPDKLIDAYYNTLIQRSSNIDIRRERIKDPGVLICFPIRAFNRIMENIVNNAKSHGFTNPDRKDYAISIQTVSDGPFVYINVANNGSPLSEKITPEQVLMLGHSTQTYQNNHEGNGGYDIQHLMEMFDSEVSVISTPDLEFTVTYQLKFKKYEST